MGRLGFNLVHQKEASKNVESGQPDQQQNERNENVEVSELLLAIEERNRTIKNLRLLLASLTTIIICLFAYVIVTQTRVFRSDQAAAPSADKLQVQMDALQGQYDAVLNAVKLEQSRNCTREESAAKEKLARELEAEKSLRAKEAVEIADLQNRFQKLQQEHEASISQCQKKQEDLQSERANLEARSLKKHEDIEACEKEAANLQAEQLRLQEERKGFGAQCLQTETELKAELRSLREERAELVRQVDAAGRRLQQLRNSASTTPRPTLRTTTARASLFESNQFKKLNDLVKEIETGSVLYDVDGFMKKVDDTFRP